MNKFFNLMALLIATISFASAQTILKEGMIRYEITDVESSDPSTDAQLSMMKGSDMTVYFSADKQRVDMDMMGGMMKMTTLYSAKDSNAIMLMEMMGKKMKMTMDPEKIKQMQGQQSEKMKEKPKVEHFKDETKEILGYKCHKVVITMQTDAGDMSMTLYVSDQIKMFRSVAQGTEELDLGGSALEYTVNVKNMMKMTYTATKVETELKEGALEVDMEGYEEVDPKMLGGMFGN